VEEVENDKTPGGCLTTNLGYLDSEYGYGCSRKYINIVRRSSLVTVVIMPTVS